jgi:Tol biopolymer transport system component
MAQVFISYSRKDLPFVEQLAADLKNAGFDVWYDVSGISGGSRWRVEIENAIRNSQFAVVILSPDSTTSEWVEREFLFASNLKRKIIPLYYRECELPLNYLNLNYIDVQGSNYRRNFPEILEALNKPPVPPLPETSSPFPGTRSLKKLNTPLVVFSLALAVIVLAVGSNLIVLWLPFIQLTGATETVTAAPTSPVTDEPTSPPATQTVIPTPALSREYWITYTSNINGNRDIFLINPVTGETRGVITDRYHDKVGTWSPDGRYLAFESSRVDVNYYQIYLHDTEQGSTELLTDFEDCSNWSPSWSPDGTQIAFYSNCENNQRDIYIMDRGGSSRQKLTTSSAEDTFPAFSPDGKTLAFTSTRSGRLQIFLMNADGSNQRYVAEGCSSTFSPDGSWLWFASGCEDSEIWRVRIDGTDLATVGTMLGQNPSVSPDGQFVVFQSNDDIWIMRVDGSEPTRLTFGDALDVAPSWIR